MNIVRIAFFCLAIFATSASAAYASPVIRTGDTVSLKSDQSVAGDFYAISGTLTNSASVGGDSTVIAGTVTQDGSTTVDFSALAGRVELHAPVGDDVRVVGGNVVLADKVGGDVVVVGGELTVLSTASVAGDIIFYGGTLTVEGPVHGSIFARAENVRIDAKVEKDIDVTAQGELVFGAHADVAGNTLYRSPKEVVRAADAVFGGSLSRDTAALFATNENTRPSLVPFFVLLFTGFVARFLCAQWLTMFFARLQASNGHAMLAGFAGLVLVPIAVLLLFVSVLGMLLGGVMLVFYIGLILLAIGSAGVFLGGVIARVVTGKVSYRVLWVLVGTGVFYTLQFIPYIGRLCALALVLTVFGGFLMHLYRLVR